MRIRPGLKVPSAQRVVDVLFVLLLSPILVPLSLIVAAVVFVDSPGSVFYRATRVGLGGRHFQMLKFRTMKTGSRGPGLTVPDDARFTPVGRFLARCRLDELPQVWNVLKGEMRVVGPRPEDPEFVAEHKKEYREILTVPPGITGTTQLVHFLDELDHHDPTGYYQDILPNKMAVDLRYVRNHSLMGDFMILARTTLVPFRLVISDAKGLLDAQLAVPNGSSRLAVGGISILLSLVLLIAFIGGTGPVS